jgi:hypothetical protein
MSGVNFLISATQLYTVDSGAATKKGPYMLCIVEFVGCVILSRLHIARHSYKVTYGFGCVELLCAVLRRLSIVLYCVLGCVLGFVESQVKLLCWDLAP